MTMKPMSPTRPAPMQSLDLHEISDDALLNAMRTVITFTVADVFSLTSEETMWASYHVGEALEVFQGHRRFEVSGAVMYELETSCYSHKLEEHIRSEQHPETAQDGIARASGLDWATVLTDVAVSTFRARPIITTGFVGRIAGMLAELGVGHPTNPRASKYLPTAIRYIMR